MKNSLVIFLSFFLVCACKIDSTAKKDPRDDDTFGGMQEPARQVFSSPEIQIGRRICSALKQKLKLLEDYRNYPDKKLIFVAEAQNCFAPGPHIKDSEFAVTVRLVGTDYEFQSMRNEYFRDVVTHQSGIMEVVCPAIEQGGEVQRRFVSGNSQFVLKFLIKEGYDRVEVTQHSPDANGGYALLNVEGINIVTQTNQAPKIYMGMEKERIRYSVCANSSRPSYLKQTLVTGTTL